MAETNFLIREYKDSDYITCETLVSNAWQFEKNFSPKDLTSLAAYLYTMGAVAESNFRMVVEVENKVVGFLFGFNENIPLEKHDIETFSSQLSSLKRLFFIKGMRFKDKIKLLYSMNTHEINKRKLKDGMQTELVLFVVDPKYQGKGYGKKLLSKFISHCKTSNVKSIIVETNKLGASSFYETVGFKHKGNFNSPLHEYVTKNGQACLYEYFL